MKERFFVGKTERGTEVLISFLDIEYWEDKPNVSIIGLKVGLSSGAVFILNQNEKDRFKKEFFEYLRR